MNFDQWWGKVGKWQSVPQNVRHTDRIELAAKRSWEAATKQAKRHTAIFAAAVLCALVLLIASQSVAILEHTARLDVLEAPPEIIYPGIAHDPTAPETPFIFARHKTSLKYKTRAIYAAHYNDAMGIRY